jgi:hypothetical protein
MRFALHILAVFLIASITGIQLVPLFDNPQHMMTPGPDCPICMAYETQVLLTPVEVVGPSLNIILIILEHPSFDYYQYPAVSVLIIRAPPQFLFV